MARAARGAPWRDARERGDRPNFEPRAHRYTGLASKLRSPRAGRVSPRQGQLLNQYSPLRAARLSCVPSGRGSLAAHLRPVRARAARATGLCKLNNKARRFKKFLSPCPFEKFIENLPVRMLVWSIVCQRTPLQSFTFKK